MSFHIILMIITIIVTKIILVKVKQMERGVDCRSMMFNFCKLDFFYFISFMSKGYINGDNNCKIINIVPNLEKKMKPLVYFVVGLIVEISGGQIDDICVDQNVLVNDLLMPFRRDTTSYKSSYNAEHGKLKSGSYIYARVNRCLYILQTIGAQVEGGSRGPLS